MTEDMSSQARQLCDFLKDLPRRHRNRYDQKAENELLQNLFWSLAGGPEHLKLFFPEHSRPLATATWKLRKAQGGADGDEFTEAARGTACGHIFKAGEATYRCRTCSADDTCVMCSRCYDSSDHTGHMVYVSVSSGNSGCCDCGDPEAWRLPIHCSIHTPYPDDMKNEGKGKAAVLPENLVEAIRMTIGRAFDYICDVVSCSPEQLRLPKSKKSIQMDEKMSRLTSSYYGGDIIEEPCEYALLLWNDEKHTVTEVRDQVTRACRVSLKEGEERAHETDDIGRSIVKYSTNLDELLRVSKIIEHIKVTVTIRSARDTFREQMCGTIIEWLGDICGCSVGQDHSILRRVICEEMLKQWNTGSEASNADVGMHGLDDHEWNENKVDYQDYRIVLRGEQADIMRAARLAAERTSPDIDEDDETNGTNEADAGTDEEDDVDQIAIESVSVDEIEGRRAFLRTNSALRRSTQPETDTDGDVDMANEDDDSLEDQEATFAGYP
ncbi:hypothetical protein B7494_g2392, partial [Chlorociboria aeruginascens]